jgi:hypothetical protein
LNQLLIACLTLHGTSNQPHPPEPCPAAGVSGEVPGALDGVVLAGGDVGADDESGDGVAVNCDGDGDGRGVTGPGARAATAYLGCWAAA